MLGSGSSCCLKRWRKLNSRDGTQTIDLSSLVVLCQIKVTMAPTPQKTGLNKLLQGLNNGLNMFKKDDGPRIESGSSSEDESDTNATPKNNSNANGLASRTMDNVVGVGHVNISTPQQARNNLVSPHNVAMDNRKKSPSPKKRPARQRKKAPKKPPMTNDHGKKSEQLNEPSVDPPRKEINNPLEMEVAFDHEYDSDGWEGPQKGPDPKEVAMCDEDEVRPTVTNVATEPTHVPISDEKLQSLKIKQIKNELRIRNIGLPRTKKKDALLAHLKDTLSKEMPVYPVNQIKELSGDDMADFAVGAYWKELVPDIDVDEPINNNFPTAKAPTIPAGEATIPPKPKKSFSATFDRPVFTERQRGGPKQCFLQKHGLTKDSLPIEIAEAYFPMYENKYKDENGDAMLSMEYLTRNTNMRANLAFAGEATCEDWSGPFTVKEMRQHLGLYVMNGLSPSPSLEKKFEPEDKANYNAFVSENINRTGNPKRRLRQFKAFFGCQDPMKPVPNRAASLLFKVLSIIKWIRKVGPLSWECGMHLGLDEQMIGFQGHHINKLRITYKREGDGFQCDALCDDGFTYSVYFRNEPAPREYVRELGLLPLHARSLWLLDTLTSKFHNVWVDNLYMSAKFAKTAFSSKNKGMLSGVTRTANRGLPAMVKQKEVKDNEIISVRGTTKAAVLIDDPKCPDLVAMSIYDNRAVHFLSMACHNIKWVVKTRQVWNQTARAMVDVNFLRINVIDDYNHKINAVDVSDQLRNTYRMTHWLRQRKWWWSIFIWGLGMLLTNSYKRYTTLMDQENVPRSARHTHYDYLLSIATAWIDRNEEDIRNFARIRARKRKREAVVTPQPLHCTRATSPFIRSPPVSKKPKHKAPRINEHSLHPDSGSLRCRLDHYGCFHAPLPSTSKHPSCALHRWMLGRENGSC
mgnify:CR=1 FL=1